MAFRGNVTAVLGTGLAAQLGKKGTTSDISLYNSKIDDCVLSFVEPSSYPDKVQSLVSALYMADQALIKVEALNAELAETIMALDAIGMERGFIIYAGSAKPEALKPLLAQTVVASYEQIEDQPMSIKEKLASLTLKSEGGPVVQIDHTFAVKGVGTVALGVMKAGTVKKHDSLSVTPGTGKVLVKNLQVHDVDVAEACAGLRVGLALKDVKPEDVPRGSMLAHEGAMKSATSLDLDISLSKYSPKSLNGGDNILVSSCLNYAPARVVEGSLPHGGHGRMRLALDKELPIFGGRFALLDPGLKMPRVFGHGSLR